MPGKARFLLLLLAFLIVGLSACSTQPKQDPDFLSLEQMQTRVVANTASWPAYDLTAAQWVSGQPLLVNRDFNFAMAMSMQGVGVAIAAGSRISDNKKLAEQLAALPVFDVADTFAKNWRGVGWPGHEIAVYGFLFGGPDAHLRTVVEAHPLEGGPVRRFVYVSDWRALEGESGWLDDRGAMLTEGFAEAIPVVAELALRYPLLADTASFAESLNAYQLAGGAALQKGEGRVLEQDAQRTIIHSLSVPHTVFSYPTARITITNLQERPPLP